MQQGRWTSSSAVVVIVGAVVVPGSAGRWTGMAAIGPSASHTRNRHIHGLARRVAAEPTAHHTPTGDKCLLVVHVCPHHHHHFHKAAWGQPGALSGIGCHAWPPLREAGALADGAQLEAPGFAADAHPRAGPHLNMYVCTHVCISSSVSSPP